jgi:alginate O-acetyltransferase complex protein AlgI
VSRSITEFWRRWHISLMAFMREYLSLLLLTGRLPAWRRYLNLWIVFLISGFWHGAAWNFLVWGAYYALLLSLEMAWRRRVRLTFPAWISVPATLILVLFGWVLFRADTLPRALAFMGAMCGFGNPAAAATQALFESLQDPAMLTALAAGLLVAWAPFWRGAGFFKDGLAAPGFRASAVALGFRFAVSMILLVASVAALVNGGFNPFIYFRF